MEYCSGQSLDKLLQDNRDSSALKKDPELCKVALDILKGMSYLHENNVVHGDLKPANLMRLTGGKVYAKITDFGMSKPIEPSKRFGSGTVSSMETSSTGGKEITVHFFFFSLRIFPCIVTELSYNASEGDFDVYRPRHLARAW